MFGKSKAVRKSSVRRSLAGLSPSSTDFAYARSLNEGCTWESGLGGLFFFLLLSWSWSWSSSNSSEVESIRERNVVDPAKRRILKCIMGAGLEWLGRAGLTTARLPLHAFPPLRDRSEGLWKPFLNKNAPFPSFSPRPSSPGPRPRPPRDLCIRPSLASPSVRKAVRGWSHSAVRNVWLGQRRTDGRATLLVRDTDRPTERRSECPKTSPKRHSVRHSF